jgi:hypothetical protein
MRLRMLRRFATGLAIVPLLAGLAFASAPGMFVCRGDNVPRVECCCPGAAHGVLPDRNPVLGPGCCCDVSQLQQPPTADPAVPRVTAPVTPDAASAPMARVEVGTMSPLARAWRAERFARPPPLSLPILLGKQSFLI